MAVSKRLRYEILRRDNHACTYCGATAPDAKLTVDHVVPTALGGSDDPSNLTTACADCNSGKSATPPDATTVTAVDAAALRWSAAMRRAREAQAANQQRVNERRAAFMDCWLMFYGDELDMPVTWGATVDDLFGAGLSFDDLIDAVEVSAQYRRRDPWRYFCGVAWNKVTALQQQALALLEAEERPDGA